MKYNILVTGIATILAASTTFAQTSDSLGAGASYNESTGSYEGALPIAIVANTALRDTLQAIQIGAQCVGSDSKLCMPSLSSVELATLMHGAGAPWDNLGITTFVPGGSFIGNLPYVCGTPSSNAATRVAARHMGVGCTDNNPDAGFSIVTTFAGLPNDTSGCINAAETAGYGAIGFAPANDVTAGLKFIKFDGEAPDLANFIDGNYAMFADVHGTGSSLSVASTAMSYGDAGAVLAGNANIPMHVSNGNSNASSECATGRSREFNNFISNGYLN